MKPLSALIPALALGWPLAVVAPAWAQSTAQATPLPSPQTQAPAANRSSGKGEAQALKIFGMLDANGDGRISREEAKVAFRLKPSLADDFRAADLNGDGYLTQQEIRTVADRRRAERIARRERERAAQLATQPVKR